ncbi:hypothetical protein [Streptomyces sp. MK37H]|uniref:hypothetical protein n=1 Tax=Streptomyces sp. MK37H TaxID=2699117 RepID=UPI001B379371|nr:hypothetical protein [Streptomyces sp. MK37H]MBP8534732.1 hypothetical protein [Streptomyces sp. MK37H]
MISSTTRLVRAGTERRQAYDHKVVAAIASDFLEEPAAAERHKARLDAKLKAAQEAEAALAEARAEAEAGEGDTGSIDPALAEAVLSRAEEKYAVSMREIEARRTEAAKRLDGFLTELGHV